jgi:hypothetical protein
MNKKIIENLKEMIKHFEIKLPFREVSLRIQKGISKHKGQWRLSIYKGACGFSRGTEYHYFNTFDELMVFVNNQSTKIKEYID